MKKALCFILTLILLSGFAVFTASATDYSAFDLVFEEKEGEKVNETKLTVFAAINDGALSDRTSDFTLEGVTWFKYVSSPEDGIEYDYVDEELKIYGLLCGNGDVFEHDRYSYFLKIDRLYAKEEDSFQRNVKINGVDVEEMNGICYNTGSEFFIKTVTNGNGGSSGEGDLTDAAGDPGKTGEKDDTAEKNKCKVCGICPFQPLGVCLFIWIAVILIVLVLIIVLVKKKNKNTHET